MPQQQTTLETEWDAEDEDDAWAHHRRAARAGDFYAVCPGFDDQLRFALEHAASADVAGMTAAAASATDARQKGVIEYILAEVAKVAPRLSLIHI